MYNLRNHPFTKYLKLKMKNLKYSALALLSIAFLTSCSSDDDAVAPVILNPEEVNSAAQITFDAKIGTADFALDTPFTINSQSYQFDHLRYWVSNIEFVAADNHVHPIADSYFLLEETKAVDIQDGTFTYPAKKRETIDLTAVPSGTYTKIRFAIGVDAAHNDNMSLQAGELSQLNGMTNVSWMWHTSYIFSSLAGKKVSDNSAISIETGLNDNYRIVEIALPAAVEVKAGKTAKINLNVDVAKILQNIDLAATPTVSASTPEAMATVADNYKNNVITVTGIE